MSCLRSRNGGTRRKDVEPVIEILAKPPGLDHLDHVAVRGGNQADVDLDRTPCADRIDLALLNGAEQLHLDVERQFRHLEKQRAAVGLLELADMAASGAGEGALLVAEQDARPGSPEWRRN